VNDLQATADVVAAAVDARMRRLGLNGFGGDIRGLSARLALTDATVINALRDTPELRAAFTAHGWVIDFHGRGVSLDRVKEEIDPIRDWYRACVTPDPDGRASLPLIRSSWVDYCESKRVPLTTQSRGEAARFIAEAGYARTRWRSGDGNTSGFRGLTVGYLPGVPVPHNSAVRGEPMSKDQALRVVAALAGMASGADLERAFIDFTGARVTICGGCGRVSVNGRHKWCGERER
jgi:hypothetical protein